MNLLLNTGNSTGLTGCPSALCVSRLSDELALSEDPVAQLTDTLSEIANQTIPKSHISKNILPKVPWFNDACKQAIKERKKAQRKLFRNPTAENILATESQSQTYNKNSKENILAKFLFFTYIQN